jgi:sec-independent protein translocase protein TatB
MSTPDMLFIFLLALILFGPKKLPEIASQIGKFVAEFKRASNDFSSQFKAEMENSGVDVGSITSIAKPGAQQTSSFAQTLLPPSVKSAISEIDSAHERLMQTARMAFDAQNFTLHPPVAPAPPESTTEPLAMSADQSAENSVPAEQASAVPASQQSFPVEAATDHPTPDSATARSDSAPQSS